MTSDRYIASLERNFHEISMARFEREVLRGIEKAQYQYCRPDFFVIVYYALHDDSLTRITRVLDRNRQSATFWYLNRCQESKIASYIQENRIDLGQIEKVANKLKNIRDGSHFHIDRLAVLDFQQPWKEADIEEEIFEKVVEDVWSILSFLYKEAGYNLKVADFSHKEVMQIIESAKSQGIVP